MQAVRSMRAVKLRTGGRSSPHRSEMTLLVKEIPAILLEVVTVDKDNLMTTVVKDGYAKYEDVYRMCRG